MEDRLEFLSSLAQNLWSDAQRQESTLLDFSFRFPDGTVLKAHRIVLAASSEFFKTKFSIGLVDSTSHESFIESFSPDAFKSFLEFLYTGQIATFEPKSFSQLFEMAQFFDVPRLTNWLIQHGITSQNLPSATSMAIQFSNMDLLTKCKELVPGHLPQISTDDFVGISEETIGILLSAAKEHSVKPSECFKLYQKWCSANDKKSTMLPIAIDLHKMAKQEIEDLVVPSGLLPDYLIFDLRQNCPARDFSKLPNHPKASFNLPDCDNIFMSSSTPLIHNDSKVWSFDAEGNFHLIVDDKDVSIFSVGMSKSRTVFVSDNNSDQVVAFNANGERLAGFQSIDLKDPCGIAVDDSKNQVHVCDQETGEVVVLSAIDGKHVFSYSVKSYCEPTEIAINEKLGLVYVTAFDAKHVAVFTTGGDFVRCFGIERGQIGGLPSKQLAIHSETGHVFVSEDSTDTVQVFTSNGDWVAELGGDFGGPRFSDMLGVAVVQDGTIFVFAKICDDNRDDVKRMLHVF